MASISKSFLTVTSVGLTLAMWFLFFHKARDADLAGRPSRATLEREMQPLANALGGAPFDYLDRNVIAGLESSNQPIASDRLPDALAQAASANGWTERSASPRHRRFCKGRLALNASMIDDSTLWQYGIYWTSDRAGGAYCNAVSEGRG